MKLSLLQVQGNQTYMDVAGKDADAVSEGLKNGMKEIASKAPGQTISGEVVGKNGNDLIISIGKNQLLHAKLDSGVMVEQGSQMSFAIKSMAGSKVVLSPLFTNFGNDPNVSKALMMAGLPETASSVRMVQTMMQEGMSIDKNSLQQMMRTVNMYPQADVSTLVQLTRMQIPVTDESIFQMNAYKNYEHQMTEGLLTIADSLTETVQGMMAEGNVSEATALYKEVFALLTEQGDSLSAQSAEGAKVLSQSTDGTVMLQNQTSASEIQGEVKAATDRVLLDMARQVADAEGEVTVAANNADSVGVLTGQEKEALTMQLKQAGLELLGDAFSKGQISEKEVFQQLGKILNSESFANGASVGEDILKLLDGKEFRKILKNEMTNQWMLKPEEVGQDNKVEHLYERLNEQMNRLGQALEQATQQGSPLAKAVSQVAGNIDFMNQLNQMFTYVQLPLKLQGQEANGELYVYTNKRNLAKEDGEVSALLHLDMENLGSVDVHVSMKDKKVATQFYLQDDSVLDLIADNIHILNDRLEKRGYSMTATFTQRDENGNLMDEMLKQDKNISILSGYSFDARA